MYWEVDRRYLLSLSPRVLCDELLREAPHTFQFFKAMLGIADMDNETFFTNQHFMNIVAMMFSIVAKSINKKASGYALQLTVAARNGGLREDSIKLYYVICVIQEQHRNTTRKSLPKTGTQISMKFWLLKKFGFGRCWQLLKVKILLGKVSKIKKQAQESLAAAMSLNSIVTSWADDCINTTDSELLQPSTGNKKT